MNLTRHWTKSGLLALATVAGINAHGVAVGQVDTFEDGTTQGWTVNLLGLGVHPAPPFVTTGGPGGVDDHFLQLTSVGGQSAGSRVSVINLGQWAGDYLSSGVGGMTMDVRNLGTTDLALRLLIADPTVGPPVNVAFSLDPILLPAGGDWTSVQFPISEAAMLASAGDVATALANATELRIYHSAASGFPGESIASLLGVDNIRAVAAVPDESSTFILSALALVGLTALRGRNTQ